MNDIVNPKVPGYAGWDCPMEASPAVGPTQQQTQKAMIKRITSHMKKRVVMKRLPKLKRKKWH